MIANAVIVLVGLWLAYGAIFSKPAGEVDNIQLAVAAALIVVCALFARRTDQMRWQGTTNLTLAALLGLLAACRAVFGDALLSPFWIILLAGIAVAIVALWSILYRPGAAEPSSD